MTQKPVNYEIYCTNCETVQVDSAETFVEKESIGGVLAGFAEKIGDEEKLCCYNGKCMIEDYTVRKTVSYTDYKTIDLDNADINIR